MAMHLCHFYLLLLIANNAAFYGFNSPSVERNLTISLLNRYQYYGVLGRPVNSTNDVLEVQYGLQLIQILDLDENQQILRTNCWSMYKWRDQYLSWNPSDYNNISVIRVFPNQIWTPDIKLYNFADVRLKEARDARVNVKSTGETLWVPQAIYKSTCSVEIKYFPFDTQICMLEFGSWTYDMNQLDIQWWIPDTSNVSMPYIEFSDYIVSPEWHTDGEEGMHLPIERKHEGQIKSVKKIRPRSHKNGRGESVKKPYPVLRYFVKLRRNSSFYVSILVIPCILLSSLTMVVFWLPPESPAKMMLGMNIFVAFFVLLQLLEESTPSAVQKFPLIGAFFCLNMVMITLSTFLATFVLNLYFKGEQSAPLPHIVRRIMLEGLGRLLMIQPTAAPTAEPKEKVQFTKKSTLKRRQVNGDLGKNFCKLNGGNSRGNLGVSKKIKFMEDQNLESENEDRDTSDISPEPYTIHQIHQYIKTRLAQSEQHQTFLSDTGQTPTNPLASINLRLENDVHELKRYLKHFVNRQKRRQSHNVVSLEYRMLALVCDRLFFVLYLSSIIITVVVCIPSSTEPEMPVQYRD